MAICTKDSGVATRPTAMASIATSTELDTKGTGRMIYSKVLALKRGLTTPNTKGITVSDASTVSESTSGATALATKVNGMKTRFQASVFTLGLTAAAMKDCGERTTWMAWEFISGTTAGPIKDNTWMTRSMDMVSTGGLMADSTQAIGTLASSMVWAYTWWQLRTESSMDFGMMERE